MAYEKVCGKYKADKLTSSTYLINPTVSDFDNIVVVKDPQLELYDVRTTILDDGMIKIFGRVFGTITPKVFRVTKDELEENFIIVKDTKHIINNMIRDRSSKALNKN